MASAATAGCPRAPAELLGGAPAVHLHHPPGAAAAAVERLAAALAARPEVVAPAGTGASELAPGRTSARRWRAALEVLVLLESRGVHRDARGRLRRSGAPGEPLGYTQISEGAARDAAAWARRQGLGLAASERDPSEDRRTPEGNLRLGGLYLAALLDRLPREGDDGELAFLRSLAGYLAGPGEPWIRAPETEFRRAAGARPEVRRYLRQAILMLGLSRRDEAWRDALGGPAPWPEEEARLRAWRAAAWCVDR